jgi:HAMP domain-containing protein
MKRSIRDKIQAAFNLMSGLMVAVAVTGIMALVIVVYQANRAPRVGARLNAIGLQIQAENLRAGGFEKAFLLNIKGNGVEKARQQYASRVAPALVGIGKLCAEGERLATADQDRARFRTIRSLAGVYAEGFAGVVAARERRGSVDTGAEGDFRNAVHQIEAKIKNSDKAEIAMLTLRRSEKDYIARGSESLVTLTHQNVKQLKAVLSASSMPAADKASALRSADVYEENFSILVAADRTVDAKMAVYEAASRTLEAVSDEVAKAGFQASGESLAASSTAAWVSMLVVVLLSAVAIGAGMRHSSRISTSIIRPVRLLTEVAERVSLGELTLNVEHTCDDEIGDLEDSLSRLVTAVRFFQAESEDALAEMKGAR